MNPPIYLSVALLVLLSSLSPATCATPTKPVNPKPTPPQLRLKERPLPEVSPPEILRLLGGPTLVTLNAEQVNPGVVFDSLAQQSGLTIFPGTNSRDQKNWEQKWPLVTIRSQNEPFWKVMQRLEQQAGFSLSYDLRPRQGESSPAALIEVRPTIDQVVAAQSSMSGFGQEAMPYFVIARQAGTDSTSFLNLGASRSVSRHTWQSAFFQVYPDPRLLPTLIPGTAQFWFDEATNENGRPVRDKLSEPQELPDYPSITLGPYLTWTANTPSKMLRHVRAQIRTLVALKRTPWEIPTTASPNNKITAQAQRTFETSQGPVSYQLELSPVGDEWELKVAWSASKEWKPFPYAIWRVLRSPYIQVLDEKGNALTLSLREGEATKVRFTLARNAPLEPKEVGPPAKIVLSIPTDVRRLTVPFEFRDLPLPTA